MALRWGICSTGRISSDFCSCIKSMPQDDHKLVAVVSRTIEKANSFAAKFEIPKAYDSYKEFANDADIEVAYIGAVSEEHVRIVVMMLKAGKHVLCEKPCSITAEETRMLNKLAKEQNLFFMEAVWTRCFPTTKRVVEEIKNGSIGDPQVVIASLSFIFDVTDTPGFLLQLGIYPIQLALMVYGEMPVSIQASGNVLENGPDVDGSVILTFSKGQKACLVYSSKCTGDKCGAKIIGTKGTIEIDEKFYCPVEVTLPSGKYQIELPSGFCPFYWPNGSGLRYEADEVKRCIRNGELECPLYTHAESEMVHDIMDEVARQVGRRLTYQPITEC